MNSKYQAIKFGVRHDSNLKINYGRDTLLWVVHDDEGVLGLYASAIEALAAAQTDIARWVVTSMPMPDIDPKVVFERIKNIVNQ